MANAADVNKAVVAMVEATRLLGEIVHKAGVQGVPEGHLYAHMMAHMSVGTFMRMVLLAEAAGYVKRGNNLLTPGPRIPVEVR